MLYDISFLRYLVIFYLFTFSSSASSAITVDPLLDFAKWKDDFCKVNSIRLTAAYIGLPDVSETASPERIREQAEVLATWPDLMKFSSLIFHYDISTASNEELIDRKSTPIGSFVRIFLPDASVSASTNGGPKIISSQPKLFAEDAWRYARFSPWIFAKLWASEHHDSIEYELSTKGVRIVLKKIGVQGIFERDVHSNGVRLTELSVGSGENVRKYKYSNFEPRGPKGHVIPRHAVVYGTFDIIDANSGRTAKSVFAELGTLELISCEWTDSLPVSDFEFSKEVLERTEREVLRKKVASSGDPRAPVLHKKLNPADAGVNSRALAAPSPKRDLANKMSSDRGLGYLILIVVSIAIVCGGLIMIRRRS